MKALTTYHIRKAALEVQAFNPAAEVYIPDEPSWEDVIDDATKAALLDCHREQSAKEAADGFEALLERRAEILNLTANAYAAMKRRWPDNEARRDELCALGADVLRICMEEMRNIAVFELEREF